MSLIDPEVDLRLHKCKNCVRTYWFEHQAEKCKCK